MKKIFIFIIFMLTIVINMLLMFIWDGGISIKSYHNFDSKQVLSNSYEGNSENFKSLNSLSSEESLIFNDCIKNLAEVDIERIKTNLNSADEDKVKDAFELMKRRLSDEQYTKVKNLFV